MYKQFLRIAILTVFTVLLCQSGLIAQQENTSQYDAMWKKVFELLNKRDQPRTALDEVNKIYDFAVQDKQESQAIKALIYRLYLLNRFEEGADTVKLKTLDSLIGTSTSPTQKAILQNIAAGCYWSYFQQNRWKMYNRTNTVDFNKNDPATWTADDFHKKISTLFFASLEEETILKNTSLDKYEPILEKGNARYLRPTLYDLLAHRALSYFKSNESSITKPAENFEIDMATAFYPAADFVQTKFNSKDSLSLQAKALQLFQKLIAFHLNDSKPDALIDINLERIYFVYQYAVMENKDELYFNAINQVAQQYGALPAASQAWYLIAAYYANQANSYDPEKDTANRYKNMEAINICNKVLEQQELSEGKANCQNLLNQIKNISFSLQAEKVNIPNTPFRTLVKWKNFSQLHLRLIKVTKEMEKAFEKEDYRFDYWKYVTSLPAMRSWTQTLPDTKDFQSHTTEIKIEALPVGSYILLASYDGKFANNNNTCLASQSFQVSNISFVNENNSNEFFILHRETGKPIANALVQVWYQIYNRAAEKYVNVKGRQYTTDQTGYIKVEREGKEDSYEGRNYQLEITSGNDRYMGTNFYYNDNRPYRSRGSRISSYLFTDRSIYRPGQTVYLKGIVINKDEQTTTVVPKRDVDAYLYDANSQVIETIRFTTNDYGSYNGKFKLPEGLMNGNFTIRDNQGGTCYLSVEEYKRPKFYVEYEKLKGAYRVDDSIFVTGTAKAYAGNNIDGAKVKYRVVRTPRFIYPWLCWRWIFPPATPTEIAHGETETDADGKFKVSFKAIPDRKINKALEPVFDYSIVADVTDINGETRSGEQTVKAAYKALQMNIQLPERLPVDSLYKVAISTTNMNDEFEPANVQVQVYKLQQPDRLIRTRFWPQPDQFVMTKEEYINAFPNDEYNNESKKESWEKGQKINELTATTEKDNPVKLQKGQYTQGWYVVEAATKDKYGQEVKDKKYVLLYDTKSNELPNQEYLASSVIEGEQSQPGKSAVIAVGSSAKNVHVIQLLQKYFDSQETKQFSYLTVNGDKKNTEFSVTEKDKGGFKVTYFIVKNNRFYKTSNLISVPRPEKDLYISYETYRDKTEPGNEEKWKVKISGYQKDKVAAEMLAGMYDASLDQFKSHGWNIPNVWPVNYFYDNWRAEACFSSNYSQNKGRSVNNYLAFSKRYDYLIYLADNNSSIRSGDYYSAYLIKDTYYSFGEMMISGSAMTKNYKDENFSADMEISAPPPAPKQQMAKMAGLVDVKISQEEISGDKESGAIPPPKLIAGQEGADAPVSARKNFNETAFFFPDLRTDAEGNISFTFTMPEALTRWKFQALAHTKDLAFGYSSKEIVTQKQLMVQPNAPRFLRQGDRMEISTKIANMSEAAFNGTVQLELLNASTMQPVDGIFGNIQSVQSFSAPAGQSTAASFNVNIPKDYTDAIVYRFTARTKGGPVNLSDGEEAALPVLTNRMLVTETMPLSIRNTTSKDFKFDKLIASRNNGTHQNYSLTLEYTANPAWYAVQSLPYLTEYPYECAEQVFNRYYANALASMIANKAPKLKTIVEKWNTTDTAALLSNLQKNQELKSALLEETPWVMQAKNETQQKKNIAILFDMVRMSNSLKSAYTKLKQKQMSSGAFPWFTGGPEDRYITQYIMTGLGHLKKLGTLSDQQTYDWRTIEYRALSYLDRAIESEYNDLKKYKVKMSDDNLSYYAVQYLYMRSFFKDVNISPSSAETAFKYYQDQAKKYWTSRSPYVRGMIALALKRAGDNTTSEAIIRSLKENATVNEEMGMYWKGIESGYYWYQAPIETQALLIEAFGEVTNDQAAVNDMKTWLLKNKQTTNWRTTKATAEACYALLLQGNDWLAETPNVQIKLGNHVTINSNEEKTESGTGYFKKVFAGENVSPDMGNIKVSISSTQQNASPSWGAVYWQYFEQLDKITPAKTPLQLTKKLFVEKNTDRGPVLTPINENDKIKVGDKIKVRIELRVDRDMEYVHMKDMRAACMEPTNVLSSFKWQGGLGYYESTKDVSTNFFFSYLRKGTYVFEYPMFVNQKGNFSNGITTIQCMYAPEFTSHSEGVRVTVE